MERNKKAIATGIILLLLVIAGAGIYYYYERAKEVPSVQEISEKRLVKVPMKEPVIEEEVIITEEKPVIEEEKEVPVENSVMGEEKEAPELIQVRIDKSDALVRKLAKELSSHPEFAAWLMSKGLIRKFTAIVTNIANGTSPRSHIDFFSPKGDFKVIRENEHLHVDSRGYRRYDPVANVVRSLNVDGCGKLYKELSPVFQESYRELGYPDKDFHDTFTKAIVELLEVPVVGGKILLEEKVITYMMTDSVLENLSQAQKHLLRMGPKNVRTIQQKLREIALATGIPENQLPLATVY